MKQSIKLIAASSFIFAMGASTEAFATYDANMVGKITQILTYPDGQIYIRLENQPTTHNGCNPAYFSIATDVPQVAANRMLGRAMTAYTTGEVVNIGYAASGDCANTYIRVYRVG